MSTSNISRLGAHDRGYTSFWFSEPSLKYWMCVECLERMVCVGGDYYGGNHDTVLYDPKIDERPCSLSRDYSSRLISPDQLRLSFG